MARQIFGAVGLLMLVLLGAAPASAHAVLESATPSDRAVLQEPPRQFSLRFDEPVVVTDLRLVDQSGRLLSLTMTTADRVINGTIAENMAPGTYTLSYRVISGDGHPVAGAVQFQIGAGAEHWLAAEHGFAAWQWGALLTRWMLYLGAFLTWGSVWSGLRGKPFHRQFAILCTVAGGIAAILEIGFQGIGMVRGSITALAGTEVWRVGAATSEGRVAALILLGLVLSWLSTQPSAASTRYGLLVAGSLAIVLALATTGHVAAISWLACLVLAVHVSVAILWVGSIASLLRKPAISPENRMPYSALLQKAVIWITIAAGLGLACWQIAAPSMVLATIYSKVLAAKALTVLTILLLMVANRHFQGAARKALAGGQVVLLVAVLGLTAALGQLTPPRHLLAAQADSASRQSASDQIPLLQEMVHDRDAMAEIEIKRGEEGNYDLVVQFADLTGKPLDPAPVTASFRNDEAGIGPLTRDLSPAAENGAYRLQNIRLPAGGRWQVEIKADLSDFDRRIFKAELTTTP
ncbi:copper resistance protein CopC [Dongia soli]|uniref:Copper resistance protein CopC n=1 Tax=Dongia soli TaxID=600628 RepID=A0ABU5E9M8_9PROT|nr:copper resistance protein CopC [Dongia soli]MDY0882561.1 copper resistance protein CopC [Dongia soli]